MERALPIPLKEVSLLRRWFRHLWFVCFLGLLTSQGWLTLKLFAAEPAWERLLDDEPVISGRHPLHLYHGYLGGESLRERGTVCCYDPAFQAGYPKTPVFDSGSRPAELFLTVAGGGYRPGAYKVGLAVCWMLIPVLIGAASWGIGLNGGSICLATGGGMLVAWGSPSRQLLENGDLDLLLSGLAAVFQTGMLVFFHRERSLLAWIGLLGGSALGWFAQPLFIGALFPLLLVYYISVGVKHGLAWHLAFAASLVGGIALNYFWLPDWFAYWWIRSPLRPEFPLLAHRTFHTVWAAPLWGDTVDRLVAASAMLGALIGVCILNQTKQRPAARLLGVGAAGLFGLAIGGLGWEPLAILGTRPMIVPALWFAVIPTAYVFDTLGHMICRLAGGWIRAATLCCCLAGVISYQLRESLRDAGERFLDVAPLQIGLGPRERAIVEAIRTQTTPAGRILWEDNVKSDAASHWSALLPILTDRAYIGGLDPDLSIEHAYASFIDQMLAGRPLASWTPAELDDFCDRYQIAWVVCRSQAAIDYFRACPLAHQIAGLSGAGNFCLFRLRDRSIALHGQATLVHADFHYIALTDVVPEDGKVVLSLHYQEGLQASPGRVHIEREPDPRDPIPFVRLRMDEPISRVTITWRD